MQRASHQKLGGQIIQLLALLALAFAARRGAAAHDLVLHRLRQRVVQLGAGRVLDFAAVVSFQLLNDGRFDFLYRQAFDFH